MAGIPFMCACGSNTTSRFHVEIRKNYLGIAVKMNRLMSDELSSATDMDCLLGS